MAQPSFPSDTARACITLSERLDARHLIEQTGFERRERSLERWLDAISAAVRESEALDPCRSAKIELERAATLVADTGAPLYVRAGAAFALLTAHDPRHHQAARAAITEISPPLVIAAAALADHGVSFRDAARHVAGYLSNDDRRAFERLIAQRSTT